MSLRMDSGAERERDKRTDGRMKRQYLSAPMETDGENGPGWLLSYNLEHQITYNIFHANQPTNEKHRFTQALFYAAILSVVSSCDLVMHILQIYLTGKFWGSSMLTPLSAK